MAEIAHAYAHVQPHTAATAATEDVMVQVAQKYAALFAHCSNEAPAPRAPVSDDLSVRSREIKGATYYLDDKFGYGRGTPVKRWWQDLEIVDGVARVPSGTNERDLDVQADTNGRKPPMGYYHASDNPAPDAQEPVVVNHKAAITRAAQLESVAQARKRRAAGGAKPAHYIPTRTLEGQPDGKH